MCDLLSHSFILFTTPTVVKINHSGIFLFLDRDAKLPPQARKVAIKDLQRLKRMGPFSPEHGVIRSWLELMVDLPWARASQETLDIHKARKVCVA